MIFNPAELSSKERYKLMIGSVIPRPIALISSVDSNGNKNLSPYSFFTIACVNPMILAFFAQQTASKPDGRKDSAANILDTGEFVVNVVSETYLEQVNLTSGMYDREIDEFQISGLTPIQASQISGYLVGESPISFECKLSKHVSLGNETSGADGIFGEVVAIHVKDDLIENFRIDDSKLGLVSRLAGNYYAKIGEKIEMSRPVVGQG